MNIKITDLPKASRADFNDIMILTDPIAHETKQITVWQLLNHALNEPCGHCGSRGKFDSRGNCGSCGAPIC